MCVWVCAVHVSLFFFSASCTPGFARKDAPMLRKNHLLAEASRMANASPFEEDEDNEEEPEKPKVQARRPASSCYFGG